MDTLLEAIDVCNVDGFCYGNYTDEEAGTGCTVIVAPEGATGGVDVRGGAPASRETDLLRRPQRILHIAPEVCLMKRLRHRAADYTTADLESPLAELHFDVLRIPLPDASYDVLICNHLLEHVADDRRALGEFYRILRPGGWGILLSPVDRSRAATFEDDSITDPEERTRIFGQYDHRRIYGRDYGGRLREAGFEVREIDYAVRFSAEERRRYALPDDWIYVVRRPL